MAKKLFVVWLLITMVIFSSISIYAYSTKPSEFDGRKESRTTAEDVMETAAAVKTSAIKESEENYLEGLAAYIRHVNGNVGESEALDMAEHFVKYAEEYNVDEKIVMAIAQNESTYYKDAVSCEDFKGLMQTGDGLARNAGYDPSQLFEPEISIKVGARYLRIKMDEFGDVRLALTAYNQGSGSVHSGNYSTGYADLAMQRAETVETYLEENGYI
ncbi:MAG: transglycosylase SLT domain-containing protein [Emergencia sp.]|nr:transglycosylase SLT domain-containing protein [Emergencia sp.]